MQGFYFDLSRTYLALILRHGAGTGQQLIRLRYRDRRGRRGTVVGVFDDHGVGARCDGERSTGLVARAVVDAVGVGPVAAAGGYVDGTAAAVAGDVEAVALIGARCDVSNWRRLRERVARAARTAVGVGDRYVVGTCAQAGLILRGSTQAAAVGGGPIVAVGSRSAGHGQADGTVGAAARGVTAQVGEAFGDGNARGLRERVATGRRTAVGIGNGHVVGARAQARLVLRGSGQAAAVAGAPGVSIRTGAACYGQVDRPVSGAVGGVTGQVGERFGERDGSRLGDGDRPVGERTALGIGDDHLVVAATQTG